ncbi:hypothetical protein WNY77_09645 [Paraglaciecola mesophila]|uniref:Metallohydrolase n=1 Tax=Paraglaciecola mesophila TaxID=197222 RepID=A0ABU9SW10_9ALTE
MTATISFFPVGNGDMTLIQTDSGRNILIDCHIRSGDEHPDVINQLKEKLTRDSDERLFIDLLVWSHPDEDHCKGIDEHFHLGSPGDWSDKKDLIFVNEIWSSPMVYRRADKNHKLCDDAKALNREVKRRVKYFEDNKVCDVGNYVLILGNDENGKTDNIQDIVMQLDSGHSYINNVNDYGFSARLLGPSPKAELDEDEEKLGKNHSSVIMNYTITSGSNAVNFLSGGDAEVICWENLLKRMNDNDTKAYLEYDVLQAPHHCSWHSLSYESLSKAKENGVVAETSVEAIEALSKAKNSAFIISSSNTIEDNEKDPPAYKAKEEYEEIIDKVAGSFKCVNDHKNNNDENVPLEIVISSTGTKVLSTASIAKSKNAANTAVNRNGGDGYA